MERRTRRPEKAPEKNTSEEEKDERREAAQNAAQRKMRLLIIGLFVCIVILTIVLCALLLARRGNPQTVQPPAESTQAPLAYDVTAPFGPSDLTQEQMQRAVQEGSYKLAAGEAGPRGISIGDSLDTLLARLPIHYSEDMNDDMAVLYSAGSGTEGDSDVILPPYGMLTVASDMIEITLVAPLTTYPDNVGACYVKYPNVWCRYTVNPEDNAISQIALGAGNL